MSKILFNCLPFFRTSLFLTSCSSNAYMQDAEAKTAEFWSARYPVTLPRQRSHKSICPFAHGNTHQLRVAAVKILAMRILKYHMHFNTWFWSMHLNKYDLQEWRGVIFITIAIKRVLFVPKIVFKAFCPQSQKQYVSISGKAVLNLKAFPGLLSALFCIR